MLLLEELGEVTAGARAGVGGELLTGDNVDEEVEDIRLADSSSDVAPL